MAITAGLGLGGGDLPAEMMAKAKAGQDEGAKETQVSTADVERMMQERQAVESCGTQLPASTYHTDKHRDKPSGDCRGLAMHCPF